MFSSKSAPCRRVRRSPHLRFKAEVPEVLEQGRNVLRLRSLKRVKKGAHCLARGQLDGIDSFQLQLTFRSEMSMFKDSVPIFFRESVCAIVDIARFKLESLICIVIA